MQIEGTQPIGNTGTFLELKPLIDSSVEINNHLGKTHMSRISPVGGYSSRIRGLTQLWSDYSNLWNRKDSASDSSNNAPALPAAPPKQALSNPHRGSRWFLSLKRSLFENKTQNKARKNAGKTTSNINAEELATEHWEDQDNDTVVTSIPTNTRDGRAIMPEMVRHRLVQDTALSSSNNSER